MIASVMITTLNIIETIRFKFSWGFSRHFGCIYKRAVVCTVLVNE